MGLPAGGHGICRWVAAGSVCELMGLAVPLPSGSPGVGGVVGDAQPAEGASEMVGAVLAAPVVAERDTSGYVWTSPWT